MLVEVVFVIISLMATSWLAGLWSLPVGARIAYYPSLLYGVLKTSEKRQWYNRVDERIVLGALPFHKTAAELVEKENIGGVISLNESYEMRILCPTEKEWNELGVEQLHIPTVDFNNAPSVENIKKSMKFIEHLDVEKSIYVHCKAGRSRSATVVVCYLMHFKSMNVAEAIECIKSKRPHVVLADKHITRIHEFAKRI